MSMYECKYNLCTAGHSSSYSDDIEEIKKTARECGVRFITTGYADVEDREGGTLYTRRTDGSLDLFDTFYDATKPMGLPSKGDDFAGFLPVTYDELRIALDALRSHRDPQTTLTQEGYDRLHPKTQALYTRVYEHPTTTYYLKEFVPA